MQHKKEYINFCKSETELPLFHQHWYLDAVCGSEHWDVALVYRNQRIVAVLPYHLKKKGLFQIALMPLLCKMWGPYLTKEFRTQRQEHKLYKELILQLPKFHYFEQAFHYQMSNWLPFYWQGFKQTTAYSYRIEGLDNLNAVLNNFATDYRNNKIPKAQKQVKISNEGSLKDLYEVNSLSFKRQGIDCPFSFEYLQNLDKALQKNHSRALFFAKDNAGKIHSGAYLVWDQQSSYLLIAGDDPELRQSGAGVLLIWEVIKYTQEVLGLTIFDFAGSMLEPVERVRRQFGAQQIPYFIIRKSNSTLFQILHHFRKIIKGE